MATSLHTTPENVRLRGMMPLTAAEWRDGEEDFGPEVKVNADKTGYEPFMCIICGMLSPPDLAQPFVCARGECKEGIWPKNSLKPFSQQEDLIVNVLHVMVDRIDKDLLRAKPFKHYNQLQWLCQLAVPTTIEGVHFYREFNIVSANKQQDPLAYLKDFKKSIRVVIQNDEKLSTLASHLLALESDVKENAARVAEIKRLEFEVARLEREMKDGAQPAAVAKVARMETAVAESERLLKEQAKELQSLKDRLANANKAKLEAEKLARKRTGLSGSTPNESTIKLADELESKVTALLLGEDGEAAGTAAITAGRSAVEAINTEGVFLGWIATLVAVQARGIGNLDAELRSFLANFADEEAATTWRGWYGVPLGITSAVWGASSSVVRSASASAYGYITSFSNARAAGGTSRSIWRRAWDSTKEHGDHFAKNAFLAPYAIGRQAWKGVWADGTEMGVASRLFSVPLVPFVFAVLTPIAAISALASGVLTPFGLGWGGKTVL